MNKYNRSRKHRLVKSIAKFFGYVVAPLDSLDRYGNVRWLREAESSNEKYEAIQRAASERKYTLSWARQDTCNEILRMLADIDNLARSILCHGVRRGEELDYFSHANVQEIVGTDLYVPPDADCRIVECDMNKSHRAFDLRFDVIYSNSIDHSLNPIETLLVWAAQLNNKPSARIVLEMDEGHGAIGSSDLDVNGLHLQNFPFYLSIETGATLYCDRIARSNIVPTRYFYFISRRAEYVG